jgi:predicted transcriptional regulator
MSETNKVNVTITFGLLRIEFSGTPEEVVRQFNQFVLQQLPQYDLAQKISSNFSLNDLMISFSNFIRITPEGARIWSTDLSDKEIISLQLVAAKIEYLLGKKTSPNLSLQEIQSSTGLNSKSISSRISELVKANHIERESSEKGVAYKMTTLGIEWLRQQLQKKSKT